VFFTTTKMASFVLNLLICAAGGIGTRFCLFFILIVGFFQIAAPRDGGAGIARTNRSVPLHSYFLWNLRHVLMRLQHFFL
jgi:hypothetical protein